MKLLGKVIKIILHCTASDVKNDDNIGRIKTLHTASKDTLVSWKNRRVPGMGFDEVGYQYIITQDGVLHECRSIKLQGAHCYGHNHDSIGICLTGNVRFTLSQFRTLFRLLYTLKSKYGLQDKDIYGHDHFDQNGKTCPNFVVNL